MTDTPSPANELVAFERAGTVFARRLAVVRLARWAKRWAWLVSIGGFLLLFVLRQFLEWRSHEILVVLALVLAVFGLAAFAFFARRPRGLDSLVAMDRIGNWKDRFSSAYEFSRERSHFRAAEALSAESASDLHIRKSSQLLPEAIRRIPEHLPLPDLRLAGLGISALIVLALLPVGRVPIPATDLVLTEAMKESAAEQADRLLREASRLEQGSALDEQEKEELERLRVSVEDAADSLADADGLTAGEMLEALESRARAAERLAEKLGLGTDEWASEELLEALAAHPDTADLSLAVRDRRAEAAADEAMILHDRLDDSALTEDSERRLSGALEHASGAATEEDAVRPVGERIGNASRKLSSRQPRPAANEFEELAKHFRFVGEREKAQEKLENMAEALREAGSEVSGSELQKMERIAEEGRGSRSVPEGLEGLTEGEIPPELQELLAPRNESLEGSRPEGAVPPIPGSGEGDGKMPVPGLAEGEGTDGQAPGEEGGQSLSAPVPGETPDGSGAGMALGEDARDGQGEGGALAAPVPGTSESTAGDAAGQAMAAGSANAGGQGGNEAGTGTAEMFDNRTDALAASRDAEVVAQVDESGESSIRSVEGKARAENATRSRQEVVTDFLAAEEQALDEQSLPMSRREHVIRYFSAIRRQFEEKE